MRKLLRWSCRPVRRDLWDYVGERLPEGPLENVERHLKQCHACRQEVESLRRARTMLSVCREQVPPSCAGWSDLQNRLSSEGLTTGEYAGMSAYPSWEIPSLAIQTRPALPSGWKTVRMATGVAAGLLFCAFSYRTFAPHSALQPTEKTRPEGQASNLNAKTGAGDGMAAAKSSLPDPQNPGTDFGSSLLNFSNAGGPTLANAAPERKTVSNRAVSGNTVDPFKEAIKRRQQSGLDENNLQQASAGGPKSFNARPSFDSRLAAGIVKNIRPERSERAGSATEALRRAGNGRLNGDVVPVGNDRFVMGSITPVSHDEDSVY